MSPCGARGFIDQGVFIAFSAHREAYEVEVFNTTYASTKMKEAFLAQREIGRKPSLSRLDLI